MKPKVVAHLRLVVFLTVAYSCGVDVYVNLAALAAGGPVAVSPYTLGSPGAYVETGIFIFALAGGSYLLLGRREWIAPLPRLDPELWLDRTLVALAFSALLLIAAVPLFWLLPGTAAGGVALGLSEISVMGAFALLVLLLLAVALNREDHDPDVLSVLESRILLLEHRAGEQDQRIERLASLIRRLRR